MEVMTGLRIIDGPTMRALLPPALAAAVMRDALREFSSQYPDQPPRFAVPLPGNDDNSLLLMPAVAASGEMSVKLLALFPGNTGHALPVINGVAVLFDPATGMPVALADGAALTEIRTAAVTAVAVDLLARHDAEQLTIVGAGPQARAHILALGATRGWKRIVVAGRGPRLELLATWAAEHTIDVHVTRDVAAAVRAADVICTTTNSSTPVFEIEDVSTRGLHVCAIGSHSPTKRELPSVVVGRASIFVESRAAADGVGDLQLAIVDGALNRTTHWTELGEVLSGSRDGRTSSEQTTVFKSVGVGFEDNAALLAVYRRAVEQDRGTVILLG